MSDKIKVCYSHSFESKEDSILNLLKFLREYSSNLELLKKNKRYMIINTYSGRYCNINIDKYDGLSITRYDATIRVENLYYILGIKN